MSNTMEKKNRVGLKSGRVDWSGIENLDCLTLIDHGLHASTISKATGMSIGQIYYRAKLAGQSLRDYRNGRGPVGTILFKKFKVNTMDNITRKTIQIETRGRVEKLVKIQNAKKRKRK